MENKTSTSPSNGSFGFGIVVEIIFFWTIVGNVIIIAVVKLYKPLTIPDILVFSLALSDLLNVLLPAHILNIIESQLFAITWSKSICTAFTWSVYCFRLSSVLTVSVISVDRLLAIRKPLVYRARVMHEIGRVKVLILLLWLFSCLIASFPIFGITGWSFTYGHCPYQLRDLGVYYGFFVEILGLLQLALVLYCYIAIRISTWNFLKRQSKFTRGQREGTMSNQALPENSKAKVAQKASQMKSRLSKVELTSFKSTDDCGNCSKSYEQKTKRGSFIKHLGSRRRDSTMPVLTEGMKQVAKMEKMMAVLVFLFYLSWIPFLGSNLYSLVTGNSNKDVTKIIGVFSLINGFLNPIVYATIYPRYKKGYVFVFRTILRLCGGKKPNITTADFNSSKIGRSRRLQTLKELNSNASAGTLRESEALPARQVWLKSTSSTAAMIPEELSTNTQSERLGNDSFSSIDENTHDLSIENRKVFTNDSSGVNTAGENLDLNCLDGIKKETEGSKHDIVTCIGQNIVTIANLQSSESLCHGNHNSDNVMNPHLSAEPQESMDFSKGGTKTCPVLEESASNGKYTAVNGMKNEFSVSDDEHVKSDRSSTSDKCFKTLDAEELRVVQKNLPEQNDIDQTNSAFVNKGFTGH